MKTYTPLKGSQGQHTQTEKHSVVSHPWGVQMEYNVHSWKWLRAPAMSCQTTRATSRYYTLGGNAEIAFESCVPRAMKNSLCRPAVSAATGRQLVAWLPAPFLFNYFTFHLEWKLKVSQQANISPGILSVCPAADSEPNTILLTFWQIPRFLIYVYQCYCVSFPHLVICNCAVQMVVFSTAGITVDSSLTVSGLATG